MILLELFKNVNFIDIWTFVSAIYQTDDEFQSELNDFYQSIIIEDPISSNLILIGEEFYEYEEDEAHTFQVEKYFQLLGYHLNRRTLLDVSEENLTRILSSRIYEKTVQKFGCVLLAAQVLVELYDLFREDISDEDLKELDKLFELFEEDTEDRELTQYDHQMKSYYLNKNKQIENTLKNSLERDFPLIG